MRSRVRERRTHGSVRGLRREPLVYSTVELEKSEFEEVGILVGRIVALVCCLLCAFPFFVIGVYNKDSSEPINFWSGDTSLKDKVKDIKGYNTEIAGLYKKCALFFLLTGILFVVFPIAGIGLLVFDCSVGIYLAYRFYKGILKRYS